MTNNPDDPNFNYYAHTRGETRKEVFYKGAFKGYKDSSNKLRSLSGKTPTANITIGNCRTYAKANGTDYEQSAFYQLTYNQAMYVLKYKNLDGQLALGKGYTNSNNTAVVNTGGTNIKGMDWGETTGKQQMKLFGLEDFWGNINEWVDGLFCNSSRHILTGTDNFNNTGSGYMDCGVGTSSDIGGYMSKPQGSTETGFIAKKTSSSVTTYFADSAHLYAGSLPRFGGHWGNGSDAGAFRLDVDYSAANAVAVVGRSLDVFIN